MIPFLILVQNWATLKKMEQNLVLAAEEDEQHEQVHLT